MCRRNMDQKGTSADHTILRSWMERGGEVFDGHLAAEARRADAALGQLAPLRQRLLQEMSRSLPTKQVCIPRSAKGWARL
jgi:protease II